MRRLDVHGVALPAHPRDFLALTKPRVMSLVIFTALCGYLVAPGTPNLILMATSILALALGAGASGALNQWYEADVDAKMQRTAGRPLPAGRMERLAALEFGLGLALLSVILMALAANLLAAGLLAFSIWFYAVVYTMWLKPNTPQNIVIGGAAGAFPPMIGYAAATGQITPLAVMMFLIIFFWTPPHFWALALFMKTDYAAAGIPMMPVVAGRTKTRRQIAIYALILAAVSTAPWIMGLTGIVYGGVVTVLNVKFVALALRVLANKSEDVANMAPEKHLFASSILYLIALFTALAVDRWASVWL